MKPDVRLWSRLMAKQAELKLSDKQFAERLNVHRVTWANTRNRRIPMRLAVVQGAAREYPDLIPDVLSFLLPGVALATIREQLEALDKSA